MSVFLALLGASGRYRLGTGGQGEIEVRRTANGPWVPLEFALDPRGKGMTARIHHYGQLRIVRQRDLVWTLAKGKPPLEPVVPLDGDLRNCSPENLLLLSDYMTQGEPRVGDPFQLPKERFWELVRLRNRYHPDPVPLEVLAAFGRDPKHLRKRLKGVPVTPVSEQERLYYIPDRRPKVYRSTDQAPLKTLPEFMLRK